MIKRLRVAGYKSFKDVEVHFEPLSIIFGPNAAGKSNLLDALGLISRIVTRRNLKEAFEYHRGLPLESFYYGEVGYEKLLEQDMAEAQFEVDVELSESTIRSMEKLIAEKRKGISTEEKSHKRITEHYLRYSVTIQVLPESGFLRVIDESLRALRNDGKVKARKPFVEKEWSSDRERLHLRMEGHRRILPAHIIHKEKNNIGLLHLLRHNSVLSLTTADKRKTSSGNCRRFQKCST